MCSLLKREDRSDGFTLVEILVVVIVVAILSAVAIPAWNQHQKQGAVASVKSDLKNNSIWHEEFQVVNNGQYPVGQALPIDDYPWSPDVALWLTPNGRCIVGQSLRYEDVVWVYDGESKRVTQGECPVTGREVENPDPDDPNPPIVTPPGTPGGGDITGVVNASVFVGSPVAFTNRWTIVGNGTDLYVNGDFECNSQVTVHGDVFVNGNAYLTNQCYIGGSLWVNGSLARMDSNATITGNLNTPGNVTIQSSNTIGGNINTPGSVSSIDGRTHQQLLDGGTVGGNINEGVNVTVPTTGFPSALFVSESTLPPVSWHDWLRTQADGTQSRTESWAQAYNANTCTITPNQSWSLNGPIKVMQDTIVDARTVSTRCDSIELSSGGGTIELYADLIIYAENITLGNNLRIVSGDGEDHTLRIISPMANNSVTCNSQGQVAVRPGVFFDPQVRTLLYTASRLQIDGTTSLRGQVIGGCVQASGAVDVVYAPVIIPK